MSELLPLETIKHADFASTGDERYFAYHTDRLTKDELERIEKYVNIRLYFGSHGTQPDHYLAAERAFDDFDPSNTTLCFENAGYSLVAEEEMRARTQNAPISERMRRQREAVLASRNSVGGNYLSSTDAFSYAQEFCIANGYNVRYADRDRWETLHWEKAIKLMDAADDDPILNTAREAFLSNDWLDYTFGEAVVTYTRLGDKATNLIESAYGPYVVHRWRQQHQLREERMVRKIKDLALEKANELAKQNVNTSEKHTIAVFFGAAHYRGVVARFVSMGLNCHTELLTEGRWSSSAADIPIDGNDAYDFMKALVGSELWKVYADIYNATDSDSPTHPQKLSNIAEAVCRTFDKLSLGSLADFYESYRAYQRWYKSPIEQNTVLGRALAEEQRKRQNPKRVLEQLIAHVCATNGQTISGAVNELEYSTGQSSRRLFGIIQ